MKDDIFEYLVSEYGTPDPNIGTTNDFVERMRGRMPNVLVDFLRKQGIGAWRQGRFQFCDPDDFQDILELIFKKDPDLNHQDCIVIGYTSFGTLLVWNRKYQNLTVNLTRGEVKAPRLSSGETAREDIAVTSNLIDIDVDAYDHYDSNGKTLFKRAVGKLGPLVLGECFGFVPALSFGGSAKLENVKKQPAVAHFGLLAQSIGFQLMDYLKRPAYVRDIG